MIAVAQRILTLHLLQDHMEQTVEQAMAFIPQHTSLLLNFEHHKYTIEERLHPINHHKININQIQSHHVHKDLFKKMEQVR